VPVQVWQGDMDANVPVVHAERQSAAIPCPVLHVDRKLTNATRRGRLGYRQGRRDVAVA
jgi:hypothetical protein